MKPGDTHGQAFDHFDYHHDDHPHRNNHEQIRIIPLIIISTKSRSSWHLWAAMGKGTEGVVRERRTGGDVQHLNKDILIMTVISDHGQADHIEPKIIVASTQ